LLVEEEKELLVNEKGIFALSELTMLDIKTLAPK